MAIVLALVSAAAYGLSDFIGGILAKSRSEWTVAVVIQLSATVCTAVAWLFIDSDPTAADLAWGAVGGIGGGLGGGFLYRGLSRGRMGVVAPVSAIGAALLPVAVGVAVGERPSLLAWLGVCCALPAIYLIARTPDEPAVAGDDAGPQVSGLGDGVLAGLGFGFLFVAVGQVSDAAGAPPLILVQLVGAVVVAILATALSEPWLPRGRRDLIPALNGPTGAIATVAFFAATGLGMLAIVSVISSLYPGLTVVLAAAFLRERIHRMQAVGLALAAVAVALVALG